MIFRRRETLGLFGRLWAAMTPRKSWRRGFSYIGKRVQRLPDTPHRIALGFACGVMASFTPFFTLHFVVAALMALVTRGNVLASALGTFVGNPLTFPFIAGAALTCGKLILGEGPHPEKFSMSLVFNDFTKFLDVVFWPYLVGGLIPGLLTSVAFYAMLRPVIAAYQNRRRGRLTAAAAARVKTQIARMKAQVTGHAPGGADP
jgi:uncharacterized protein (DUF2062 family)